MKKKQMMTQMTTQMTTQMRMMFSRTSTSHKILYLAIVVLLSLLHMSLAAATTTPAAPISACPPESKKNVNLLMETRLNALSSTQLLSLLRQSEHGPLFLNVRNFSLPRYSPFDRRHSSLFSILSTLC